MNRHTNKFHCSLPHPTKGEMDKLRVNCKPVEPETLGRLMQIEFDMLSAFVQIVDAHNRLIIQSAKQTSTPAPCQLADSHASEEDEAD